MHQNGYAVPARPDLEGPARLCSSESAMSGCVGAQRGTVEERWWLWIYKAKGGDNESWVTKKKA
jgi:hypothetical protein